MPTKAHIKSRQSLGYLMQHLGDAPGYSVWIESNGNSYESNMRFLKEACDNLELTPEEMWLSHLACYNLIEKHLLAEENDLATSFIERIKHIQIKHPPRERKDDLRLGQAFLWALQMKYPFKDWKELTDIVFSMEDKEFNELLNQEYNAN